MGARAGIREVLANDGTWVEPYKVRGLEFLHCLSTSHKEQGALQNPLRIYHVQKEQQG